jgi:hypothetical protein
MRLSVSGTYHKHGHVVVIPISVVDESQEPEVYRTDLISSGYVELLAHTSVIQRTTFDKFNGTSENAVLARFTNPLQFSSLRINVSVTLMDSSELSALDVPVVTEDMRSVSDVPLNPNTADNPAPGDRI